MIKIVEVKAPMGDQLGEICEALRRGLELPREGTVAGFKRHLSEEDLVELPLPGSEEIPVISAVDGGSNTVIRTPTLGIVLNRVYYNQFLGFTKMDECETVEFVSKTEMTRIEGKSVFRTEIYPLKGACQLSPIDIDLRDQSLMSGTSYGDLGRALSVARRFCEWKMAERALDSGSECIVMDGALQTAFKGEPEYARSLYEKAKESSVVVAGLSKSNALHFESGHPIAGTLDLMAGRRGFKRWIVELGKSEEWAHKAVVYYAKLHEMADRGYRLDVYEGTTGGQLELLLRGLLACSAYFGYPGYPYPLIDAHAYAKVAREEVESLRGQILDRLNVEEAKTLELMEKAGTPHDVLDSLGG